MTRIEKIYRRLDTLETEFRTELAQQLEKCVATRSYHVFACHEFLPDGYPPRDTKLADRLLDLVETIRQLKEKVREPFSETAAAKYRQACQKWADSTDHHRGSAESIARQLLAEISSQQQTP